MLKNLPFQMVLNIKLNALTERTGYGEQGASGILLGLDGTVRVGSPNRRVFMSQALSFPPGSGQTRGAGMGRQLSGPISLAPNWLQPLLPQNSMNQGFLHLHLPCTKAGKKRKEGVCKGNAQEIPKTSLLPRTCH